MARDAGTEPIRHCRACIVYKYIHAVHMCIYIYTYTYRGTSTDRNIGVSIHSSCPCKQASHQDAYGMCAHMYIYLYTYTYIHTYIHAAPHVCICMHTFISNALRRDRPGLSSPRSFRHRWNSKLCRPTSSTAYLGQGLGATVTTATEAEAEDIR